MKRFILVFIVLIQLTAHAQPQAVNWAGIVGNAANQDAIEVHKQDSSGNIYAVGTFKETVDLDLGTGVASFTNLLASYSIWVAKYNATGLYQWGFKLDVQSSLSGKIYDIEVTPSGDIYLASEFNISVDINPGVGTTTLTPVGGKDIFLAKYSTNGGFLWGFRIGSTAQEFQPSLDTDRFGNIIIGGGTGGSTENIIDFDPSAGTANVNGVGGFVAKYTAAGAYQWAFRLPGVDINTLKTDFPGNVIIGGRFSGTVDFDPGSGVSNYTLGSLGPFIAKYSPTGQFVWTQPFEGSGAGEIQSVAVDAQQNIYVAGNYQNQLDVDPGLGVTSITAGGITNYNAWYGSYTPAGAFRWAHQWGKSTLTDDAAFMIVNDSLGFIYVVGTYKDTVDLDPGPGTSIFYDNAKHGCFLKTTTQGVFQWGVALTGSSSYLTNISVTPNGYTVTVAGYIMGTIDVGPPNASYPLSGTPSISDALIVQYRSCTPTSSLQNQTACDSYILNGQTYTSSGTYTQQLTNVAGCDSTITLNLTINNGSAATINTTACDTYTLNGQTYTSSGIYSQLLTNAAGCDSTITLNLTINNGSAATINTTACDTYTLNGQTYTSSGTYTQQRSNAAGCDSIITLNLTINNSSNATITTAACQSYTLNGQTYTSSGSYTQQRTNAAGCDSIITLNLTIDNADVTVTQNLNTLTAASTNDTYQWINCDGNTLVNGETQASFTATTNGLYAVIVTQGSCIDTSSCITVQGLSTSSMDPTNLIIYPNPTTDQITIQGVDLTQVQHVYIVNALGQVMYANRPTHLTFTTTQWSPGIYFITLTTIQGQSFRNSFIQK